jgi:hypothetical protein
VVELVRVDVQRDAGTHVAKLPGCADRVDAGADQVTGECVAKIVEAELWHSVSVQAGRVGSLVETPFRHVVPVDRPPCGGDEDMVVPTRKSTHELRGSQVLSEVWLQLPGERDVSTTSLR